MVWFELCLCCTHFMNGRLNLSEAVSVTYSDRSRDTEPGSLLPIYSTLLLQLLVRSVPERQTYCWVYRTHTHTQCQLYILGQSHLNQTALKTQFFPLSVFSLWLTASLQEWAPKLYWPHASGYSQRLPHLPMMPFCQTDQVVSGICALMCEPPTDDRIVLEKHKVHVRRLERWR